MAELHVSAVRTIRKSPRSRAWGLLRATLGTIGRRPRWLWRWAWDREFASLLRDKAPALPEETDDHA